MKTFLKFFIKVTGYLFFTIVATNFALAAISTQKSISNNCRMEVGFLKVISHKFFNVLQPSGMLMLHALHTHA